MPQFLPLPHHSQPSQARRLLGSCQHRPIRFSFHRRSIRGANQISRGEEIGGLAVSRGPSSIFFPPFIFFYLHSSVHTHSGIHSQERGLPWETEAWVKEGCWQRGGLTHLLAAAGLSTSLQRVERNSQTISLKAFWVIPGPLHVPSWERRRWAAHVCTSPGIFSGRTKAKAGKGAFFHSCFCLPTN